MSEPGGLKNTPYPQQRTEEQHAAVRRRSGPVAFAGVVCGVAGLVWSLMSTVNAHHPPQLVAVNLSFCAMMMGAGILFYAKGTSGTRVAALLCVIAIVAGLAGSLVFTKQTVEHRSARETLELTNMHRIALAAQQYAQENGGVYPADLGVLLEQKRLTSADLLSPFAATATLTGEVAQLRANSKPDEFAKTLEAHSDYQYAGADLKIPSGAASLPAAIVVAYGKEPIMRVNMVVAFADGSARFATLDEAEPILAACDVERVKLGLGALKPPEAVERALRDEKRE